MNEAPSCWSEIQGKVRSYALRFNSTELVDAGLGRDLSFAGYGNDGFGCLASHHFKMRSRSMLVQDYVGF